MLSPGPMVETQSPTDTAPDAIWAAVASVMPATTRVSDDKPVSATTCGLNGPMSVPDATTRGNLSTGRCHPPLGDERGRCVCPPPPRGETCGQVDPADPAPRANDCSGGRNRSSKHLLSRSPTRTPPNEPKPHP